MTDHLADYFNSADSLDSYVDPFLGSASHILSIDPYAKYSSGSQEDKEMREDIREVEAKKHVSMRLEGLMCHAPRYRPASTS